MKRETRKQTLLKFFSAIIFLSFIIWGPFSQKDSYFSKGQIEKTTPVSIGHSQIKAFVADTSLFRKRGLGGKDSILSDEGMLFIFETPAYHGIWMKDMRFPIDIFWIDEMKRIVSLQEVVLTSSYPEIFTPKAPAKYVLETRAGFARENNVKIGDKISF